MTEFEIQKLRSAMLYLLNLKGSMSIFYLFKILYFADKDHMAKYGRRIINDTFCALEYGPVPTTLYDILNDPEDVASKNKEFSIFLNTFTRGSNDASYFVFPEKSLDPEEYEIYLSKSDKEHLLASYEENINLSFKQLSEKSHDEAWHEVWNINGKKNNHMKHLTSAKSAGASHEMLSYIKDTEEIAKYLMPS